MKWWHAVLGIVGVVVVSSFVVPPSIRCKFTFWDSQACAKVQSASKMLNDIGLNVNPDEPIITQL